MHIQFAELPVFDQDRAKQFYIAHFGPVRFPGDHMGFGMHAEPFANVLDAVLRIQ